MAAIIELDCNPTWMFQIREVAQEHGVTTDDEFSTMLAFYHDLGVIVHFSSGLYAEPSGLGSTVILRPQWLVDMFGRIITAPEHRASQVRENVMW